MISSRFPHAWPSAPRTTPVITPGGTQAGATQAGSSVLLALLALNLVACGEDAGGTSSQAGGHGGEGGHGELLAVSVASGSTSTSSTGTNSTSSTATGEGGAETTTQAHGPSTGSTGVGGEGGGLPLDPCPRFASEVVAVEYGPGAGFGQDRLPDVVLGPPHGGGCCQGSLDVLSLGNGGAITLGFAEMRIVDGPGPDFIVFENAFFAGGNPESPFAEPATVEVSADGEIWHTFPCTDTALPFAGCAGVSPVYAHPDNPDVDPHDPEVAGGDAFDLADLGLTEIRFVRIVDRVDITGFAGNFDLDAVAIVHGVCSAPETQ